MKKKYSFTNKTQSDEMSLQITSMADIFTILLVFLLKSYTAGTVNITPTKGVLLPEAVAADSLIEALKIEISETAVQVEGQPATSLKSFQFESSDLLSNGSSKSLSQTLENQRKRQLLIAKSNSDVKVDPKIVIIADQKTPYSTVKAVLASAALNGYTDFKLAVVKGN